MKTLKKIIVLIVLLFATLAFYSNVEASSDLYLNSLNFDVQINSDGSMDVVETWNIDVSDTNTLYKTFKIDSTKYTSITNGSVSRITSSGLEIPMEDYGDYAYHLPTDEYYFLDMGSNYEVAWGTGYENSSGTAIYKISYHVNDAIAIYNDCAEMYWQFLGSDFEIPAKKITGTIKLPSAVSNLDELRVWGHTPDLNGTITKASNDTVTFEVNNNQAEKMVEVRIAMPNNGVAYSGRMYNANRLNTILQEENSWANEANATRMGKIIITVIICLVIFGVLIYFAVKNIRILATVKPVVPTTHYDYFRDLPRADATPAEALYILNENYQGFNQYDIGRVFSSTLLNLALKKFIKIEEIKDSKGKEDSRITILNNNSNQVQLNSDEIYVYNFLITACKNKTKSVFNKGNLSDNPDEITMQELKKYINANSSRVVNLKNGLDKSIKKKLTANNILDLKGIKRRNANMAGCSIGVIIPFVMIFLLDNIDFVTNTVNSIGIPWYVLVLALVMLIADFVLISKANKRISVYTQAGVDEQDKWKAFKKYMEDFSLLKEKDVPDLAVWERYLVYATAFGISEKVIKQLKIVYPDFDNYDYNIYPTIFIMSHMDFSSSFKSVSNAMSSSFSSGSGGGGGFSGGGGRRRRSVVVEEEGKTSSFSLHFLLGDGPFCKIFYFWDGLFGKFAFIENASSKEKTID